MNTRAQQDLILQILASSPMTRNQINRQTRRERKEIPIQTLCRRLRELEDMGRIVCIEHVECPVTRARNKLYRLTGSARRVA